MLLFPFLTSAGSSGDSSADAPTTSEFSWENFWKTITTFFTDNVWTIIAWFATLFIGLVLIYFISRFVRYVMRRQGVDEMAVRFVATILKVLMWLILILILLAIMGVPITGLTTGLSAAILAVGMALKDFLSHVAAGIILVMSKNYTKGDYIQVNGLEGSIVDINLLFTTLKTYESTRVTVPNSVMVNNCVTNLEALRVRRIDLHFPIAHDSDLEVVRKTLVDVMKSDGRIKSSPEPLCRLNNIKPECLDMFLTCYVDIEDYWDMYFYIYDQGYDALKRAGIHTPYQRVTVYQAEEPKDYPTKYEGLPTRVEKVVDDDKIRRLNLIDYDELSPEQVAEIMAHNKKVREKRRAAKKKAAQKDKPKKKE